MFFFLYQQMSLPLHRHEQPSLCNTSLQANRAHRDTIPTQRDSQPKATISLRRGTRHLLPQMDR